MEESYIRIANILLGYWLVFLTDSFISTVKIQPDTDFQVIIARPRKPGSTNRKNTIAIGSSPYASGESNP